jgi:phenylacetate-CoA ligase
LNEELFGRITALCAYAAENSPFYSRTLCPIRNWRDFFSLPYLTADHIRRHVNPDGTGDLLTGPVCGSVVVRTSGISGPRKLVYREFAEQRRVSQGMAMAMRLAGFTKEDRVANLFPPGASAWIGAHEAIEMLGATLLPLSTTLPGDVAEQVELLQWLLPTAIVGSPSILVRLIAGGLPPVRAVLCGGEALRPEERAFMEKSLGAEIPLAYGNVECGMLGVQCEVLRGSGRYHILSRDVFIEIIDPNTGMPADEGEILVTHLHRRLQPMIRYRLGDRGRHIDSGCLCGLALPLLELEGRSEELQVSVGGFCLIADKVAAAVRAVPRVGERFQIRVRATDGGEEVRILFEGEGASRDSLYRALVEGEPALRALGDQGSLVVEVVSRGAIPTKAGKTPRIVDERST